jgi:hypothetical protein
MTNNTYIEAYGIMYKNELRSIHKSSNQLQPIFEAFTNAWEAVFEHFSAERLKLGNITMRFYFTRDIFDNSGDFEKIEIQDNGVGIDERSLQRIINLRDNSKGRQNKGTGRVQYLHYFNMTTFDSIYCAKNNTYKHLALSLSKNDAFLQNNAILKTDIDEESDSSTSGTKVTFSSIIDDKKDLPFYKGLKIDIVKKELIRHYLSRFCENRDRLPNIKFERYEGNTLVDTLTLTELDIPNPDKQCDIEVAYCKMDGNKLIELNHTEKFTLLTFINNASDLEKNIIYFVSDGALSQECQVEALPAKDSIDNKRYLFLLRGEYFDTKTDDTRSDLGLIKESDFKKKEYASMMPEEAILVDRIKSKTNEKINSIYPEIQAKRDEALNNLDELKHMFLIGDDAVTKIRKSLKTSDTDEAILTAIYKSDVEIVARKDADIKARYNRLKDLSPDSPSYQEQLSSEVEKFVQIIPQQNRTSLVKYIARRKLVLDIFEMILNQQLTSVANKKQIDEKVLHNLLFQQHSENPLASDLWLIDDQYIYFKGCSEHTLNSVTVDNVPLLKTDLTEEEKEYKVRNSLDGQHDVGNRRPDVLIFPEEGKCIIIEFKAPHVEVSEHLSQINRYAMSINNLSSESFNIHTFYGYLVGENIDYKSIEETDSTFKQAPNLKYLFRPAYNVPGRFGRPNGDLYTEIIKYSDILKRAQLRNRIFTEKLEEFAKLEGISDDEVSEQTN